MSSTLNTVTNAVTTVTTDYCHQYCHYCHQYCHYRHQYCHYRHYMPPCCQRRPKWVEHRIFVSNYPGNIRSIASYLQRVVKLGRMEAFVRVQNMEFFILEDHRHFAPFKSYKDCMEWINQARDYVKGKNQRKLWYLNLNQNVCSYFSS